MKRPAASLGSFLFFLVAPGVVAGLAPWWISRWHMQPPFLGIGPLRVAGGVLIALGTPALLDSFVRFALQGLGTPAPILPTEHLVVTGLYRYVRNPMYVGVVAVIVGQSLLLGDAQLLSYGALVWLAFYIFVLGYEEPTLRRTFGDEYERFCTNVPRWIPRLRPVACGVKKP
jgi:protein-S-isoprenylcysteine O-methyltransferase Ste14